VGGVCARARVRIQINSVRDSGRAIAVDSDGSAYVAGETLSPDFPTLNAAQRTYGGNDTLDGDAFVTRLSPAGSAFVYSTFLGGSVGDGADGAAASGGRLDASPSGSGASADVRPASLRGGCACEVGGTRANPGLPGWGGFGLLALIAGGRRSKRLRGELQGATGWTTAPLLVSTKRP
jgi:MYXO-CTERM domain-containing protein